MTDAVIYRCARLGCEAESTEELAPHERGLPNSVLLPALLPEGWGYDEIGPDEVLHCPEHRSGS